MAIINLRRSPWSAPLTPLADRDYTSPSIRRLFDAMLDGSASTEQAVGFSPAVDIVESDSEFMCSAELPGFNSADVNVAFEDGVLTVSGEKKSERESKDGKKVHVWERTYGSFTRTFTFPVQVDAEKVGADFKDGVLTVRLPKAAITKPASRKIEVKSK